MRYDLETVILVNISFATNIVFSISHALLKILLKKFKFKTKIIMFVYGIIYTLIHYVFEELCLFKHFIVLKMQFSATVFELQLHRDYKEF